MPEAVYVPWLHMHQPLVWLDGELVGNLEKMLDSADSKDEWDARLMARAYKNPAKYVKLLTEKGKSPRVMLDFSGILLESLDSLGRNGIFDEKDVQGEKIGDIIGLYRQVLNDHPDAIEMAGTSYSHCYFPATPKRDWGYHIEEWRKTFSEFFGEQALSRVKGFWLPEMGVPGDEADLNFLINTIKAAGYEWLILPLAAVETEGGFSYERSLETTSQPHLLRAGNASIPVIVRIRYDFIDQQAGCDAGGVYNKAREAARVFKRRGGKKPALVVPASDGENGNVMMNEFFKATFVPFFVDKADDLVSSMTVSNFLHRYYGVDGKIVPNSGLRLKPIGGSWVGGHERWEEGDRRLEIKRKIEKLSEEFHEADEVYRKLGKTGEDQGTAYEEAKCALLIAETSCYVYWNQEFWFDQGEKTIEFAHKKISRLKSLL